MKLLGVLLVACGASSPPAAKPSPVVASDTPETTSAGSTFVVPAHWSVEQSGAMTVLTPPEGDDSHVVLIESTEGSPDAARDAAWKLYRPTFAAPIAKTDEARGRNGWTETRQYTYQTDNTRAVVVTVAFGAKHWAVAILDLRTVVMDLRVADLSTIFDHLYPRQ